MVEHAEAVEIESPGLRRLVPLGWTLAVLSVLIPLLAIGGVAVGLFLRSRGRERDGRLIAIVSAVVGVLAAIIWFVFAYR